MCNDTKFDNGRWSGWIIAYGWMDGFHKWLNVDGLDSQRKVKTRAISARKGYEVFKEKHS